MVPSLGRPAGSHNSASATRWRASTPRFCPREAAAGLCGLSRSPSAWRAASSARPITFASNTRSRRSGSTSGRRPRRTCFPKRRGSTSASSARRSARSLGCCSTCSASRSRICRASCRRSTATTASSTLARSRRQPSSRSAASSRAVRSDRRRRSSPSAVASRPSSVTKPASTAPMRTWVSRDRSARKLHANVTRARSS